jgi:hypothetical protein
VTAVVAGCLSDRDDGSDEDGSAGMDCSDAVGRVKGGTDGDDRDAQEETKAEMGSNRSYQDSNSCPGNSR